MTFSAEQRRRLDVMVQFEGYEDVRALLTAYDSARRDAERYRWLRTAPAAVKLTGIALGNVDLDGVIDAAIEERNSDVPREVTATEHEILGRALRRSAKPLPAEQGHILTERIGELLDPPRDGVQPEPREGSLDELKSWGPSA